MRKTYFVKMIALISAIALLVTAFAGCGSSKDSATAAATGNSSAATKVEPPTEISVMVSTNATEIIDNTNVIWKEIEKVTNTKLNIQFVPVGSYTEKLNIGLAAGNVPEVTQVGDPLAANVVSAVMSGAFWEVGKYIKDYPELQKYPEAVWKNTKYSDGKNYALPRTRPVDGANALISFRQDWLDKLKLKTPETLDEVYSTLKAFVENDPDGNGQKDTTGLIGFIATDGTNMASFAGLMNIVFGKCVAGNFGEFYDNNGSLESALSTPEYKEAIAFIRKLYADGLLHKDFATMKQQQVRDAAMAGKVGAILENIPGSWVVTSGLQKVVPNAEFISVNYLKNKSGQKLNFQGPGTIGAWIIRKKDVDETKLKKILKFFNETAKEEVSILANYGFKDTHYTKNGDLFIQTEQAKTDKVGTIYMGLMASMYDKYYYASNAPGITPAAVKRNIAAIDEIGKISVPNPTIGLVSDTWNKYSKEYDKKITDMMMKIIIGTEKIDNWDAFAKKIESEEYYKKGLAELAAAYKIKMAK